MRAEINLLHFLAHKVTSKFIFFFALLQMGTASSEPIQFTDVKKPSTTLESIRKCAMTEDEQKQLMICREAMRFPRGDQFLEELMHQGTVLQVPSKIKENMDFFFYAHRNLLSHHSARVGVIKKIVHEGFEHFKPNVCIASLAPFAFNYGKTFVMCVHWAPENSENQPDIYALWIPGQDCSQSQDTMCKLMGEINKFVADHTVVTNKVSMFNNRENDWRMTGRLPPRSLQSVYLADEKAKDNLLKDLEDFYKRQPVYEKMGVICKRGYLLYGPPGTGKTSLIRAIASHMGKCVACVMLDSNVTDQHIQDLMSELPENSIVVFEDIDRMKDSKVSLMCLLSVLDGNYTTGAQVVFLTSNNPHQIEPALLRPGRADVKLEVSFATKAQVLAAFHHIFQIQAEDEKNQKLAHQVASMFPEHLNMPMATVMEAFIRLMSLPPDAAAKQLNWQAMANEQSLKTTSYAAVATKKKK